MMKKSAFLWLAAAAVLASCTSAPRVVAYDMKMSLPPRQADSVLLYEVGAEVPPTAQVVGSVKVTDGGMTRATDGLYAQVLTRAVEKTAECGGNALRVDRHKEPSVWTSPSHRIWGTMLLLPDSIAGGDTTSVLNRLREREDRELLCWTKKVLNRPHAPANQLAVSLGPTWITSKIYTDRDTYTDKGGFGLTAEYTHYWKSGLGVGVVNHYNHVSFSGEASFSQLFIGPSLSYAFRTTKNWIWEYGFSLGYAHYSEQGRYTENGLGVTGWLGVQYMLSDHVGLGLKYSGMTQSFEEPAGWNQEHKDEFYGIRHTALLGGLRIYF